MKNFYQKIVQANVSFQLRSAVFEFDDGDFCCRYGKHIVEAFVCL